MKKSLSVLLALAVMAVPMLALADYGAVTAPGRIQYLNDDHGELYVQCTADYPKDTVYHYRHGAENALEPVLQGLASEKETAFVIKGSYYYLPSGGAALIKADDNSSMNFLPDALAGKANALVPFLYSYGDDSGITCIMAQGEAMHLCHLNLLTGESKSISMGDNIYVLQPYKDQASLVFRSNQTDGTKEICSVDWNSMKEERLGSLPAAATSIAYDSSNDAVYYIENGVLMRYSWNSGSQQIMSGLPLWTDQRAFIINDRLMITPYVDADEELIVIDLNEAEEKQS